MTRFIVRPFKTSVHAPGRESRPSFQRLARPVRRFIRVAARARIRDLELIRHARRNEAEGVAAHVDVGDRLLDLRHVTRDALAPRAAGGVMRVLLDARGVRTVGRCGAVTRQTQLPGRLHEVRVVRRAVGVVTTEAGDASVIHDALHEIVSLHPVLMSRVIGEVRERQLAELVFLELPEVLQTATLMKTDRPVVVLTFNRILERLTL